MNIQQALRNVEARLPISDPTVKVRVDRAYGICISAGYTLKKHSEWVWHVYRESTSLLDDNSVQYIVDKEDGCNCPDALDRARAGLCKHRIAVMIKEEMLSDMPTV